MFNQKNKNLKKCLIVVDYQYDFVADDGLLTISKPAQDIEKNILKRIDTYLNQNSKVILTLDAHTKETWETHTEKANFPFHCEKGSKGYLPYNELKPLFHDNRILKIEKNAFAPIYSDIKKIVEDFDQVELTGVVTHICVLQLAIFIYNISVNLNKPIKIIINKNACASFNKELHDNAILYMQNVLNCEII